MKKSTRKMLAKLWAEPEDRPKQEPKQKLVPATPGRFKLGQRVAIAKDQPDYNTGASAYPKVGLEGTVVVSNKYEHYQVPEGKIAVRFSSKALGYLDYMEPGHRYCVLFVWEWALKPTKKKRK